MYESVVCSKISFPLSIATKVFTMFEKESAVIGNCDYFSDGVYYIHIQCTINAYDLIRVIVSSLTFSGTSLSHLRSFVAFFLLQFLFFSFWYKSNNSNMICFFNFGYCVWLWRTTSTPYFYAQRPIPARCWGSHFI